MKLRFFSLAIIILAAMGLTLLSPTQAAAESDFFGQLCASCHTNDTATCNGCHSHGVWQNSSREVINLTATTDLDQYQPGQTVTVTFSGGYRQGWIRAILYDHTGREVDKITGPTGMGDDGTGSTDQQFPVLLSATAPSTPGFYTWSVSWFGSPFDDDNSNVYPHMEENVLTNEFEVLPGQVSPDAGNSYEGTTQSGKTTYGHWDDDDKDEYDDDEEESEDDSDNGGGSSSGLVGINLTSPSDRATLTSPPTFVWTANGGTNNSFYVDLTNFSHVKSSEDSQTSVSGTSWTLPASIWDRIPSGQRVYWRVRGSDADSDPQVVVISDEMWSFYKK